MTALALARRGSEFNAALSRPASGAEAIRLWELVGAEINRFRQGRSDRADAFSELGAIECCISSAKQSRYESLESVLVLADKFLLSLPSDVPSPEVTIDTDGDILFDWSAHDGKNLSVSLRHDGRIAWAGAYSTEKVVYGIDRFDDKVPGEIVQAVRDVQGTPF